MGSALSGGRDGRRRAQEQLRAKVAALEEELREARSAAAARAEAWEAERRERGEETGWLRRRLKEAAAARGGSGEAAAEEEEEEARREEVIGKWKQLYLAIKTELDELIQRTRRGDELYPFFFFITAPKEKKLINKTVLCFSKFSIQTNNGAFIKKLIAERSFMGAEQGTIEQLQGELKAKEDAMETLRSRVEAMEQEASKRDREMDILKQSLRILSNDRTSRFGKNQIQGLVSSMRKQQP